MRDWRGPGSRRGKVGAGEVGLAQVEALQRAVGEVGVGQAEPAAAGAASKVLLVRFNRFTQRLGVESQMVGVGLGRACRTFARPQTAPPSLKERLRRARRGSGEIKNRRRRPGPGDRLRQFVGASTPVASNRRDSATALNRKRWRRSARPGPLARWDLVAGVAVGGLGDQGCDAVGGIGSLALSICSGPEPGRTAEATWLAAFWAIAIAVFSAVERPEDAMIFALAS